MMKGSVLIISRTKDTRKICSQMLPWEGAHGGEAGRETNLPLAREWGWRLGRGPGRAGGTHFVAEVDEKHGLQEAYYGHDDLGRG